MQVANIKFSEKQLQDPALQKILKASKGEKMNFKDIADLFKDQQIKGEEDVKVNVGEGEESQEDEEGSGEGSWEEVEDEDGEEELEGERGVEEAKKGKMSKVVKKEQILSGKEVTAKSTPSKELTEIKQDAQKEDLTVATFS